MFARTRPLLVLCILMVAGILAAGCIAPLGESESSLSAPAETLPLPADAPVAEPDSPQSATPELIEADYESGEIDAGQRILYLTYAVYEPASLPEQYASDAPWRGTMIVQELKEVAASPTLCEFAPEIQSELQRLIQGANQCS